MSRSRIRTIWLLAALVLANAVLPVFASASAPARAQSSPTESAKAAVELPPAQYKVHAGDELDIFVWGEERMQRSVRVQPDGTFAFPLAGTIRAADRSVAEISSELRERISVNYRSTVPDVTVSVRTAMDMRFYVVGKVRTPGSFTSSSTVNVLQALSMAGGTAEFANIKNAVIMRQQPDGTQRMEPVSLKPLLRGKAGARAGGAASLPMLKNGDVLVIP
ncbi:MAG: polysaccharide biosynthesis/export family protein [Sphingomonas sp.]|uniref:polysaccharide biosynthesis/export family protein n=1 Tax=Sphingomonas sp. TaxID=28214 RepID=UPI001AFF9393|nr:polysaccharide biosynthesis/export family protein [Sphingomonas sp.]MBO9623896.1 polysaccharide biosynthesis/export family protein [Sphingomonas sp.]